MTIFAINPTVSILMQPDPLLQALCDELIDLCKKGIVWARRHHYPEVERYPQYARAREIGEVLNQLGGMPLMQKVVMHVNAKIKSRSGGQTALLEYGWSGIGGWMA